MRKFHSSSSLNMTLRTYYFFFFLFIECHLEQMYRKVTSEPTHTSLLVACASAWPTWPQVSVNYSQITFNPNLNHCVLLQYYFLFLTLGLVHSVLPCNELVFSFPHKYLKTCQSAVFIIHFSLLCCHHWTSLFQNLLGKMTRNIAFYFLVPSLD